MSVECLLHVDGRRSEFTHRLTDELFGMGRAARISLRLEGGGSAVDGIYFASETHKTKLTRQSFHLVPPLPPELNVA